MIQCVSRGIAVCAAMGPGCKEPSPESVLCGALGLEFGLVDQMIEGHSIGEYGSRNGEATL